jgi:DNA-binding LytR/AlgR family response regulator
MTTILIDDEPKAIELLKSFLQHFSQIELAGSFRNGLKAFEFLSKQPVDLIFLDINMPHISGMALAKLLPPSSKIIFTTAYAEYAVESYEVRAVDYLLKPISFERFAKSISSLLATQEKTIPNSKPDTIFVKSGPTVFRIMVADILYLQKDGNYLTYFLPDQKVLARASTQEALTQLPDHFLQCHKSFIINSKQIIRIDKEYLSVPGAQIPIGGSFKKGLMEKLTS